MERERLLLVRLIDCVWRRSQRARSGENKQKAVTSDPDILAAVPLARAIYIVSITAMITYNAIMAIAEFRYAEICTLLIEKTDSIETFVASYVPAIANVSAEMNKYGSSRRISIVSSEISVDISIMFAGLLLIVAASAASIRTRRDVVVGRVILEMEKVERLPDWQFKLSAAIVSSLAVLLIYSGIIYYYPIALYRGPIDINLSLIVFFIAMRMTASLVILVIVGRVRG